MRLLLYSGIGVFIFFWPIDIGGKSTIFLDHVTSYLVTRHHFMTQLVVSALIIFSAFRPWWTGQWKSSPTSMVLSVFKVLGLALTLMYWLQAGPAVLFEQDMLPFLFEKLVMPVGLAGILLARFTPVFDAVGWLLYPFVYFAQLPEPLLVSKALATGLAEVFLPAVILKDSELIVRFIAGVVPVSSIIFFSALVPCILATEIPLSVSKMLLIWLIRMLLSIVLAAAVAHGAIALGWLV